MGGGGAAARSQKQNNYEKDFAPETAQPGEEETRHRGHNGGGQHTGCRGKGENSRNLHGCAFPGDTG